MEGLSSGSEDDDDRSKHKKQRRVPVADDLDDDYLTDKDGNDDFGLGKGITLRDLVTIRRIQDEESDEIDIEEYSSQSEEDEDEENDESDGGNEGKDDNEGQLLEDINDFSFRMFRTPQTKNRVDSQATKREKKSKEENNKSELALAYIFPCPSTLENFLEILDEIDDKDVPVVVYRIRILHHIKLSPDNQEKLEV
jgi:nucleolar protein 14